MSQRESPFDARRCVKRLTSAAEEQAWNQAQLTQPLQHPMIRAWLPSEPAIVFGCSQRLIYEEALEKAPPATTLLIRRAGGGAVLSGPWMLSLSVLLPTSCALIDLGLLGLFKWLAEHHVAALRQFGIPAIAASPTEPVPLVTDPALKWACFANLGPWEIVAHGRKLAGLAQFHSRNGILLSSGILLEQPDWQLMSTPLGYSPEAADALQKRTVGCDAYCADSALGEHLAALLADRIASDPRIYAKQPVENAA